MFQLQIIALDKVWVSVSIFIELSSGPEPVYEKLPFNVIIYFNTLFYLTIAIENLKEVHQTYTAYYFFTYISHCSL